MDGIISDYEPKSLLLWQGFCVVSMQSSVGKSGVSFDGAVPKVVSNYRAGHRASSQVFRNREGRMGKAPRIW
jgi:hypothetical protein